MPRRILLGLDLGTSVLKVCALDAESGDPLARAEQRLDVEERPGGGREQSVVSLDRALADTVARVRTQLGDDARWVTGIGLAAQGGSSIIVRRATGDAVTPMMLWNDARAQAHIARLATETRESTWEEATANRVPPHGLGRLAWLKETRPDLFTDANLHVGAGEYGFFRLTGVWRQDPGNAIQIGSYHAVRRILDDSLLRRVGVPLSFVAPLRRGHETAPLSASAADRLGLPAGVPVAGPYIDQEAGYQAAIGLSDAPLQISLGTAWVGNFGLPRNTTGASPIQIMLPAPVGDGRLIVQPMLAGNVAWEWGLAQCLTPSSDDDDAYARAAAVFDDALLPSDGLVALPWITQANPWRETARGGGAFLGVGPHTDRTDLLRALATGLVCELKRVLDAVVACGAVDTIALSGGVSRAEHFRRLVTLAFDPLRVTCQTEATSPAARGALFALSQPASRLRGELMPRPSNRDVLRFRSAYDQYLAVFDRVIGATHAGAPFRFDEEES